MTGIGLMLLAGWARRSWLGLIALDAAIALTVWVAVLLLGRSSSFDPALRTLIPGAGGLAVAISPLVLRPGGVAIGRRLRSVAGVAGVAAAIALFAGPAAYSFANLGRALSGNNVIAGPASVAGGFGLGGGARSGGAPGGPGVTPPSGARTGTPPPGATGFTSSSGPGGGGGQLSNQVIAYLEAHQGSARYLLAATGSQTTAPIIIQTGRAVVTIGGFSGSDPAPTVSQLAKLVADGQLKYVLVSSGGGFGGGGGGGAPGASGSSSLTTWVKAHGTVVKTVTVSGGTLYQVG